MILTGIYGIIRAGVICASDNFEFMFPFEKFLVYQKAYNLNLRIYQFLKEQMMMPVFMKNQLARASLSIMLNVAEGSAKLSLKDRRNFFIIARGSAFECASLVVFMHEVHEMHTQLRDELYNALDEISRMLYAMIRNLQS